jgi:chromosome segregation ATPase
MQNKGAVMASRQAYVQKLNAQLKEWDAKLDQLSAKAQKATADARINYENELESLRARRAVANRKLEELGQRGESAWEDMKDGVEKVWDEMGKAMEKVAARFK